MAKLVDAQASGACGGNTVSVQIRSPAPASQYQCQCVYMIKMPYNLCFLSVFFVHSLRGLDVLNLQQAYQLVCERLTSSIVPLAYARIAFFDQRTAIDRVTFNKLCSRSGHFSETTCTAFYQERVVRGKIFYEKNRALVREVEKKYCVNASMLLSIVGIETNYGAFVGKHDVFNVWYTQLIAIPSRRIWAAKELGALLYYCYVRSLDPHTVRGSYAGAFGYGQFIPSSFNAYGVTLDGQGLARHDLWPDTLASIAHYLVVHGYKSTHESVYKALYAYNHSAAYVAMVMQLSGLLDKVLF